MITIIDSEPIRAIHKQIESEVAHVGFIVNAGTRDELKEEHGVAHLIEHLLFKGTKKRNHRVLAKRFDDVGADINAYTTKEETCILVSFRVEHYRIIMEALSDMLMDSIFRVKEVEKEIEVIKEEIQSYNDIPSELIFDDFEDQLYAGYSIGRNILGTTSSLDYILSTHKKHHEDSINKSLIHSFFERNYTNENIIFWSAGNIKPNKFKELYKRFFSRSAALSNGKVVEETKPAKQFDVTIERNDFQSNVIIGCNTCSYYDDRKDAFVLLNNYLWNPGMTSRLNYALREKRGYVYQIESSYTPYVDVGNFNIFYECDKSKINKINKIIFSELNRCRTKKIGSLQLNTIKKQLKGNMAILYDSNQYSIVSMAKSLMIYDKIESMEETYKRIDNITAEDMLTVANDFLDPDKMSILKYI